jgi:transposase-like protein
MAGKRKSHSAAFKAQVALAAVKGDKTINELASHYGVHPTLIHAWKKQLLAGAEAVFASGAKTTGPPEDKTAELFEQIGRLKVELAWGKRLTVPDMGRPYVHPDWGAQFPGVSPPMRPGGGPLPPSGRVRKS